MYVVCGEVNVSSSLCSLLQSLEVSALAMPLTAVMKYGCSARLKEYAPSCIPCAYHCLWSQDGSEEESEEEEEEGEEGEEEGVSSDGGYFDAPPTVDTDIAFTDMNLSRPLLRVSYTAGKTYCCRV